MLVVVAKTFIGFLLAIMEIIADIVMSLDTLEIVWEQLVEMEPTIDGTWLKSFKPG